MWALLGLIYLRVRFSKSLLRSRNVSLTKASDLSYKRVRVSLAWTTVSLSVKFQTILAILALVGSSWAHLKTRQKTTQTTSKSYFSRQASIMMMKNKKTTENRRLQGSTFWPTQITTLRRTQSLRNVQRWTRHHEETTRLYLTHWWLAPTSVLASKVHCISWYLRHLSRKWPVIRPLTRSRLRRF